jgi:hypothetical protein
MTLYKVLCEDGSTVFGHGRWNLPTDDRPGEWMPKITGELIPCKNGYHLCGRLFDLVLWLGPAIYKAQIDGETIDCDNKIVARRARLLRRIDAWNNRAARLFACDCAERVLHLTDSEWSRNAIDVSRRYANGDATIAELTDANDAVWLVQYSSARDAAWEASTSSIGKTVHSAACNAARAIAIEAGAGKMCEAALVAERRWQADRLEQYLKGALP